MTADFTNRGPRRKAVAYLRVSTKEADGTTQQQNGLEAQLAEIRAFAKSKHIEVVSYYQDLCSGTTPLKQREGLLNAINDLADHKARFLIVQRRDRLARDVLVACGVDSLLAKRDVRVLTVQDDPDGALSPELKMFRTIMDAAAEYERDLIAARTRAALKAKRARGERLGAIAYCHTPEGSLNITMFLELKNTKGWTWAQISKFANEAGIRPKHEKLWSQRSVRDAVKYALKHPQTVVPDAPGKKRDDYLMGVGS